MAFFILGPRLVFRTEVKKIGGNYFCGVLSSTACTRTFLQSSFLSIISSLSLELPQVGVVEIQVIKSWYRLPEEATFGN